MKHSNNTIFGKAVALDTLGLRSHIAIINAVFAIAAFAVIAFFAIHPATPPVF